MVELSVLEDDGSDALRLDVYERILRPSFSEVELPDFTAVGPAPGRTMVVALDGRGPLAAGVSDDGGSGISLLSYLATLPDLRSTGLGSLVLDRMRTWWRDADASLVLAEVHDPRVWPTSDDEYPEARLRFYRRNGCSLLTVPWMQPSLGHGRQRGMLLLVVAGDATAVDRRRLLRWVDDYFSSSEGALPVDAEYRALRRRFELDDIGAVDIEDLESVPPITL